MRLEDLMARLERFEKRLSVLEGKDVVPDESPAPVLPKKPLVEFPKMIYRRGADGSVQSLIVHKASDLPATYAESPADVDAVAEMPIEPEPEPVNVLASIPENWRTIDGRSRIALARRLPGGDEVRTMDDADIVIEMELERRGDAD